MPNFREPTNEEREVLKSFIGKHVNVYIYRWGKPHAEQDVELKEVSELGIGYNSCYTPFYGQQNGSIKTKGRTGVVRVTLLDGAIIYQI